MKRLTQIIIVVLLGLTAFLSYQVQDLSKEVESLKKSGPNKEISKVVSEFETDVTKVVSEVNDKVVSVVQTIRGQVSGSGTGVIYEAKDNKHYIVTNHHVIDNAESIIVRLANGEEVEAELLGSDAFTDLALLAIEGDYKLEPFKMGDSSRVTVGEFVVAIGSPLGVEFSNTTTFGIISGKDRLVPVDLNNDGISDWDMVVLQTDAAINPGNSGGALVNMNGELIGINSLKISSEKIEGMGFSIPINEVLPIVEQLKENGKVNYPLIGISAIAIDDMAAIYKQQMDIAEDVSGVLVVDVQLRSAAYRAGIKKNDIITSFDGVEVNNFKDFRKELYKKKPTDTVKLQILRAGESVDIEVTLD